jgi:hypothetical protein
MNKSIPPKPTHRKRSPFYWWRRFPTHQSLHPYKPLIERIRNGDFDYPEYFEQATWETHWCEEEINSIIPLFKDHQNLQKEIGEIRMKYAKRRNLLLKDGLDAENKRLQEIVKQFSISLGGTKEEIWNFMSSFDGTLEEMFWAYSKHRGIRIPEQESEKKIVEKLIGEQSQKRGRGRPRKNPLLH